MILSSPYQSAKNTSYMENLQEKLTAYEEKIEQLEQYLEKVGIHIEWKKGANYINYIYISIYAHTNAPELSLLAHAIYWALHI